MPERDTTRVNERIRVPEVRVIDQDGAQIGVMRTDEAMRMAQSRDLDLVEVAPEARPPVCRILDYSKYKYEQAQKLKQARKRQQQIVVREIKLRPKIAEHDYATKKGHVERFLRHKDKVKVTIMFRGREVTHPERGQQLLERLAEELSELAQVEQRANLDGRNMTMLLGPSKAVLAGTLEEGDEDGDGSEDGALETTGNEATEATGNEATEATGNETVEAKGGETADAEAAEAKGDEAEGTDAAAEETPAAEATEDADEEPADDAETGDAEAAAEAEPSDKA